MNYEKTKIEQLNEITASFIRVGKEIFCGTCFSQFNDKVLMEKDLDRCGHICWRGHFLPDLFLYHER